MVNDDYKCSDQWFAPLFFLLWQDYVYDVSRNVSIKDREAYKTGTRQCTQAVWSALMHYLGLLEFSVWICDASYITTHKRPT